MLCYVNFSRKSEAEGFTEEIINNIVGFTWDGWLHCDNIRENESGIAVKRQTLRKLDFLLTHWVVDSVVKNLKLGHDDFVLIVNLSLKLSSLIAESIGQTHDN